MVKVTVFDLHFVSRNKETRKKNLKPFIVQKKYFLTSETL